MIENAFFFASILLNIMLAFFTAAFAIEIAFMLFRIKNQRARATLRVIPYFAMIFDRVFTEFNAVNWLNPLSCNSCVQRNLLQLFFPHLHAHLNETDLSLVTYLASFNPTHISEIIFILVVIFTLLKVAHTLFQAHTQNRLTDAMIKRGKPCARTTLQPKLAKTLEKINLVSSDEIQIPMAANANTILMPAQFCEEISQEEFEAIIAHEYTHLTWKDHYTRLTLALITSVFWWVPTQWWTDKVKLEQEMACDNSVLSYHPNTHSLASALLKVVKETKNNEPKALCSFADKANATLHRFKALVDFPLRSPTVTLGLVGMGLGIVLLVICMV